MSKAKFEPIPSDEGKEGSVGSVPVVNLFQNPVTESSTDDLKPSKTTKSSLQLVDDNGDENKERGNWSNKMDFVLSCLGYAVGLGNVWRFPYLCYRNGGGAFLIPYAIMLFFAGLPLFFLEVSFGQYSSLGPITAWRAVPLMKGLGVCQIIVACYVGIYYNVIITYTIFYFFTSIGAIFRGKLPWVGCDNDYNTLNCSSLFNECISRAGIITDNGTCVSLKYLTEDELSEYNVTGNLDDEKWNLTAYSDPFRAARKSPSEEYWKVAVLQEAPSMNDGGGIVWQLALCLMVAWIIVFFCLIKGIKSSGKVVYFTATFPYVVLFILLIRGVTLPGAIRGIRFYVIPKFERLSDPQVWLDAAIQIFYSLSAAGGGLTTLASYNKFKNNAYFDSLFVAIANCCTSVFAGFVIFSVIGFMAETLGKEVDDVVDQGFGLAFVAYPAAVAHMPGTVLWAILFFFMLITLGLDSQFAIMENIITALVDQYPTVLRPKKKYLLGGICIVMFLLGLICVTRTGGYWVSLLDSYGASFTYLVYAVLECVGIAWMYGARRFVNDIRCMVGDRWVDAMVFYWWPLNWCCITPGLMTFVLMFNFFDWSNPEYNGPYPTWANAIGYLMFMLALIWIPINAVYQFIIADGDLYQRWKAIVNPSENWGPALSVHRLEAYKVHVNHGTTMGGRIDIDGSGRQATIPPDYFRDLDNPGYDNNSRV
ncbi:sodium- and chloride-dependent neutral and basic amino acid transporter B(0+)-like isoform X1 [Apostichopus japonicus]|uniref:sodium- and chloride-dependent neutral and basic amino acid transporter B(0+)-like isoform X1 n=1 Tax=Stichopus japonicus TaxID=307972 RepID=UPI003AB6F8F0